MKESIDGCMDRLNNHGWMEGWRDRWTDGCTHTFTRLGSQMLAPPSLSVFSSKQVGSPGTNQCHFPVCTLNSLTGAALLQSAELYPIRRKKYFLFPNKHQRCGRKVATSTEVRESFGHNKLRLFLVNGESRVTSLMACSLD